MRRIGAATAIASVIAGRITVFRLASGWCSKETYPCVGSRFSLMPNTTIRRIPVTNAGVAIPIAVKPAINASKTRLRQIALIAAAGTAIRRPSRLAAIASSSVAPIRWVISVVTGNWLKYEWPKFPRTMPPTQCRYWYGSDRSRPSWCRMAWRARGSTSRIEPPSFVIVGSPGITRRTQKMRIELSTSSPTLVITRIRTYAFIDLRALLCHANDASVSG